MPEEYMPNTPTPQKESGKPLIGWKIGVLVLLIVLVIALIAVLVMHKMPQDKNTDPEQEETPPAFMIGKYPLSAAEANYFYIDYIRQIYENWSAPYGEHAAVYIHMLYGLDPSRPLDEQIQDAESGTTWAEHFADQAFADAAVVYALYGAAVADGFTLSEEDLLEIDNRMSSVDTWAEMLGYSSPRKYLRSIYGKEADMVSYKAYLQIRVTAKAYARSRENSFEYDDAALRAFEEDKYHMFSSFTYSYYYINAADYLSGSTENPDGTFTYTDQQILSSVESAKKIAGAIARSDASTRQELDSAIQHQTHSEDTATTEESILYASVQDSFRDWLCYEGRQPGDISVVANLSINEDGSVTTYGYFVVMFHNRSDNTIRLANVRHILFPFEGGYTTQEGLTVYTEAEKKAVLEKTYTVMDLFMEGSKDEKAFAALASAYSADAASASSGGLYRDVYPGQMVDAFNDWCFGQERHPGDVGILETEYGYHILFYVESSEQTYRDLLIAQMLRQQDYSEWYDSIAIHTDAVEIDMEQLELDYVIAP